MAKTREDVDRLKAGWEGDPCWDIYDTEGFEEYRDELKAYLQERGVPAMIYYPVPLYKQEAFREWWPGGELPVTEQLCNTVFSLPMHSEMTEELLTTITTAVKSFFGK